MSDAVSVSRMAANRQAIQPVAFPAFGKTGNKALDEILERWREMAGTGVLKALNALAKAPDFPLRRNVSGFSGASYLVNGFSPVVHRLATVDILGAVYKTKDATGAALTIQPSVASVIQTVDVDTARVVLATAPSSLEEFRVVILG